MHIGSQVTKLEPFEKAYTLMAELVRQLIADGHDIRHVDIGGGLGVPYRGTNDVPPSPAEYAHMVRRVLGPLGVRLMIEPGRMIAGNAGILVSRVVRVKDAEAKRFVIIDAAMNDLIRPTLYEAYHDIWPVEEAPAGHDDMVADVVGPVCESGDYMARSRHLPPLKAGAIMTAGAYGAVQSSTYNTRPLVPEVLVRARDFAIVRPRPSFEELIGLDRLAAWQDR
jgi:diaminopimelate decarboxylase